MYKKTEGCSDMGHPSFIMEKMENMDMEENTGKEKDDILQDVVEMLTPEDIMRHLKIGRNKTYQLLQVPSFPKIKIGNAYRIPKDMYKKWISDNVRKTIYI